MAKNDFTERLLRSNEFFEVSEESAAAQERFQTFIKKMIRDGKKNDDKNASKDQKTSKSGEGKILETNLGR